MATRFKSALTAAAACASGLSAAVAVAEVDVDITPGIYAGITYTDNLRLQPDSEKIDQLAYVVTPEILFSRDGPRMVTNFNYRAQGIFYSTEDRDDSVLNFMQFSNNATLVENSLFLDVSSNVTQQILDPSQSIPGSGVNDSANRSAVFTAYATPRWQATLGDFARSVLTFRGGIVDYKEPALRDSKEMRWDYSLNGALGGNSSWSISYFDSITEYDTDDEVNVATATAEVALGIGAKTALVLMAGFDSNSFTGPAGRNEIEDDFWMVGFRGTLGRFTEYDIRGGQRFFGETYSANISRQRGKLTGEIDYIEGVTSAGPQQLDYRSLFEFISEITGVELPIALPNAYVRKRLQLSGTYQMQTGSWQLAVFDEDREYLGTTLVNDQDGTRGAALTYRWTANARTTLTADLSWRDFTLRNSNESPEDTRLRVQVGRKFGDGFALNLTLLRNERGSTAADGSFTENAASIGLSKQF